jgi:hypothetical protein
MREPENLGRRCRLSISAAILAAMALLPASLQAKQLKPRTVEAFDEYVRTREAAMNQELQSGNNFLWIDALPQPDRDQAYAGLKRGEIIAEHSQRDDAQFPVSIPGGLIHDWVGIVFIPGVTLPQVVGLLQDYDHDSLYFSPEIQKSKLLQHSGNDFKLYFRIKRVQIITVVLDTEYDVHYTMLDSTHVASLSHSTRISEVENPGEPQETDKPVGDDHGFLWRLYTYFRFYQADGGVYLQTTAISLTRDIPTGLGWLIRPFVENIPVQSVHFTLESTRKALESKSAALPDPSLQAQQHK